MESRTTIVRFGLFELDKQAGELRKNGVKVKVEGQPIQVLELLLERPQQVVTQEEIRAKLWPNGTVVEFEHSIKSAVKRLRQALDDDAEAPRYVQTLPRRGYRFIAPVSAEAGLGASNGHSGAAPAEVPQTLTSRWPLSLATGLVAGVITLTGLAVTCLFLLRRAAAPPELAERQITANPTENFIRAAAISPDGQHVAYQDLTGLYVRAVDSGEIRSVPLSPALTNLSVEVKWFPDGAKLLAAIPSPQPYDLWVIPILGEAPPHLIYRNGVDPAISPDGQSLAFMSCCNERSFQEILVGGVNGETPRKLVSVQDEGSAEAQLENQSVWYPAWSPDGRWIAYLRKWKAAQGPQMSAIEVRPAAGGPAKILVSAESLPKGTSPCAFLVGGCTVWSPDGRLLFAASQTAESPSPETKYSLWQVRVEPRTGEAAGRPRQLTAWTDFALQAVSITQDGKHLAILRQREWLDVYLAELAPGAPGIAPHRFTLDNRGISAIDSWSPDSQAILFSSSQNGKAEVFRKGLNENISEAIVRGPEAYRCARLTADGAWMLYVEWTPAAAGAQPSPDRLMRRPAAGGPPEMVLQEPGGDASFYVWDYKCPLKPGSPCVLGEKKGDELDFYSLDPLRGKGRMLGKAQVPRPQMDWDVSPDGSRLALIGRENYERIGVLTFSDGFWHEISPDRPLGLPLKLAWAADGKGLFMTRIFNDSFDLVHVTLAGKVEQLSHNGQRQGVGKLLPSPDGKYLAYEADTTDSNIWMLENF
jgi:DNA-binding winged helix-turn-helix (wHTH) protein/Tol biopolymer transport system component